MSLSFSNFFVCVQGCYYRWGLFCDVVFQRDTFLKIAQKVSIKKIRAAEGKAVLFISLVIGKILVASLKNSGVSRWNIWISLLSNLPNSIVKREKEFNSGQKQFPIL